MAQHSTIAQAEIARCYLDYHRLVQFKRELTSLCRAARERGRNAKSCDSAYVKLADYLAVTPTETAAGNSLNSQPKMALAQQVLQNVQLDAAVELAVRLSVVGCQRMAVAIALGAQARGRDAVGG